MGGRRGSIGSPVRFPAKWGNGSITKPVLTIPESAQSSKALTSAAEDVGLGKQDSTGWGEVPLLRLLLLPRLLLLRGDCSSQGKWLQQYRRMN